VDHWWSIVGVHDLYLGQATTAQWFPWPTAAEFNGCTNCIDCFPAVEQK
jgi:hypothetical protein